MQRLKHFVPCLKQHSLSLEVVAVVLLRNLVKVVNHSSLIVAVSTRELGQGAERRVDDFVECSQLACLSSDGQVGGRQACHCALFPFATLMR